MSETLREKQSRFAVAVAKLIQKADPETAKAWEAEAAQKVQ